MIQPSPQPAQFADRLAQAVAHRRTPVLVGLDPRYEQLPAGLATAGSASPRPSERKRPPPTSNSARE